MDRPTWWLDFASRQIRAASEGLDLYNDVYAHTTWEVERLAAVVGERRQALAALLGRSDESSLRERPMISKLDLRGNSDSLLSGVVDPIDFITVRTSGTTGVPTVIHHSGNYLVERAAQRARMYETYGLSRFPNVLQVSAKPGGPTISFASSAASGGSAILTLNTSDVDNGAGDYIGRLLRDFRPEIVAGQSMELLAFTECVERGVFQGVPIAVALSQGDDLTPGVRTRVQETLGVRLFDTYGLQEVGQVAFECPESPGSYHINAEAVDVRTQNGSVILTSLINRAMLLVNYQTEDEAEVSMGCPCDRALPVLRNLRGRRRPLIRDRAGFGRQATKFQTIVSAVVGEVWQAEQSEPGSVVVRCTSMPSADARSQMQSQLSALYGVDVQLVQVDRRELLTPGGKLVRYGTFA